MLDPCSKVVNDMKVHRRHPHASQKQPFPGQLSKACVDVDDDEDDDESDDNFPYPFGPLEVVPCTAELGLG